MRTWLASAWSLGRRFAKWSAAGAFLALLTSTTASAQEAGGEAGLKVPDLSQVTFLGIDGHKLLLFGIVFCVFGLIFGLAIYIRLKGMPVHKSMRDISELIYETCKTYLFTQGKFLVFLWLFIAVVIILYFGVLAPVHPTAVTLPIILVFSVIGMAGSYGVAWFGIRVNTFANSRTAFAALRGKPYPIYHTPLEAGMSIGMMLISVELLMMLFILLFIPGDYAGPCFIGFAIGESLGAAVLRIAGGIFTKIADIGSDLMKIVFKIKEDDARNPGVIADCTGDNAGDSVGPSADGFETYGVTGVALITFILLAVKDPKVQVQLLVDLRDAHHDAGLQRRGLLHQRLHRQNQVRQRERDELRSAPDLPRLDHFHRFDRPHLRNLLQNHPHARRRHFSMVEVGNDHLLRHARRRGHSRIGESVHFHGIPPRKRSRLFCGRRRRVPRHPLRLRCRQFLCVLHRPGDGPPDVHGLPH
jgi:hypothetical protein